MISPHRIDRGLQCCPFLLLHQECSVCTTEKSCCAGDRFKAVPGWLLSCVMDFLFKLETVEGIDFKINVQKPPRSKQWECSISFDGKSTAEFNADMCLFLEQWEDERSELRA